MLERERDVVERVQVEEALVGGEEAREGIGLEAERARRDFAHALRAHAEIDVAVAGLGEIEQDLSQERGRNLRVEAIQQDPLVLDHLVVEQPRVRIADGLRVAA